MKKHFGIALLGLVGVVACNRSEESTSPAVQREKTLHALAIKNNAVEDWEKSFTNKIGLFTIDLQDTFLNKSAPFEFTGTLEDIRREAGHVVADFYSYAAPEISLSLRLICTEDQRKILTDKGKTYAVIAAIQKVVKQGDLSVVSASRDENGQIDDATFEANWDTDTYCVTGTCLDLSKLDE